MNLIRRLWQRKFVRDTVILQFGKAGETGMGVLSSVLIIRLMSPESFGVWALANTFFSIWRAFNLTGLAGSTRTRLGIAIGEDNDSEILDLMANYVKITLLWSALSIFVLAVLGPPIARIIYDGDSRIGVLAAVLGLTIPTELLFLQITLALYSRRLIREGAILDNINHAVLLGSTVVAVIIDPRAEAMVLARIFYTWVTMFIGLWMYINTRERGPQPFPTIRAIIARTRSVPLGLYWRFGFTIALDRNIANLYTQLPVQLVGIFAGEAAAGYLQVALNGTNQLFVFTSAIFDNVQAVVPVAVGRRDYVTLRRNFMRVLLIVSAGALGFYIIWVIFAPIAVPFVYGNKWRPVIPAIRILAIYGAITTAGGLFGPMYRAFDQMRAMLIIKIVSFIAVAVPGVLLVKSLGVNGGAWLVNLVYVMSVTWTIITVMREMHARADAQLAASEIPAPGEAV